MNLLHETVLMLNEHALHPTAVAWVGLGDRWFTWADFARLADEEYEDSSAYGRLVDGRLILVGDGWWLTRWYDENFGESGWRIVKVPVRPTIAAPPPTLFYEEQAPIWASVKVAADVRNLSPSSIPRVAPGQS